jgi:hypothetical protein
VTLNNVLEAALYVLITFGSVSALAVAVLGPTAALERWLDNPDSARGPLADTSAPPNDPRARPRAA